MWKTDEEEEEASSTLTCADNQHTDQSPLFDSHHPLEHKLSAGLRNTESNIPGNAEEKDKEHKHMNGANLAKLGLCQVS